MENAKTILLIEDEVFISELYQLTLQKSGFNVICSMDGEDGLKKAQEVKPDLIFLDIMMPKMHGIEVLKHLKESANTQNIPVVILTNLGDESMVQEALQNGALQFMVKAHINANDLAKTVDSVLENATSAAAL